MDVPLAFSLDAADRSCSPSESREFAFCSENQPAQTDYLKPCHTSRNLPRGSPLNGLPNFIAGEKRQCFAKRESASSCL